MFGDNRREMRRKPRSFFTAKRGFRRTPHRTFPVLFPVHREHQQNIPRHPSKLVVP
jgi:hypothetical protein